MVDMIGADFVFAVYGANEEGRSMERMRKGAAEGCPTALMMSCAAGGECTAPAPLPSAHNPFSHSGWIGFRDAFFEKTLRRLETTGTYMYSRVGIIPTLLLLL